MGSEKAEQIETTSDGNRRKRRRRRRNRRPRNDNGAEARGARRNDGRPWRNRDEASAAVNLPTTGRLPLPRSVVHGARTGVRSSTARRRRMARAEMDELAQYLKQLPERLVANLYAGVGGQPDRVPSHERMIQLCVRAIAQGNRLGNLVRSLHHRDRQALAILVQVGGLAHHAEFRQELVLSLGGNEREWVRVMGTLGDKGLVAASPERDGEFFYVIPDPLIDHLIEHLHDDLALPSFDEEDVRVVDPAAFSPPLEFSIVTLVGYIDRHPPRLTQRHEIFKVHKDEMDQFFSQLWAPDSELFNFHIDFLMMHGMVELKGDRLAVNRAVVEEWLQLDAEDHRHLVFRSLDKRFPLSEWVLWAIHEAGGAWVPERPLQALYRRWRRGEEWRERYHKDQWASPRSAVRESYGFAQLVHTGMLELGQWGREKFYRLSPRAQALLSPAEEEGFQKFYLTPNFEIMAPAGLSPMLLFRAGEIAELTACDRANTYKISEVSIEGALERGWRRDDILDFLRENSQIGLPENVEQTLRGWMGHHGDVEFHDVMLLTVHRSQIRRLETHRALKPFLLHRFVPGMYAVDRSRLPELTALLAEAGFTPSAQVRTYPDDPHQVEARKRLMALVTEAREQREDLLALAHAADTPPDQLRVLGGGSSRSRRRRRDDLPPRRSPREVRELCERAIALGQQLDLLYVTRDSQRKLVRVLPERLATNPQGQQVLVAMDVQRKQRRSYQVTQVERLAVVEA